MAEKNKSSYTLFQHRHNFAAWAAATAARRGKGSKGFTSVRVKAAIEHAGIDRWVQTETASELSAEGYDKIHEGWCTTIIEFLRRQEVNV
jgi:hypothetical protein